MQLGQGIFLLQLGCVKEQDRGEGVGRGRQEEVMGLGGLPHAWHHELLLLRLRGQGEDGLALQEGSLLSSQAS